MCSRYTKACWADFPETASLRVKVEYNTWRDSREREPFHYLCDMAGERYRPQVVRDWLWRLLFRQRANNCALQETGHESLSQRCVLQGHARKQRSSICGLRSHLARTLYCTLRHQVPCTPHMMKQVIREVYQGRQSQIHEYIFELDKVSCFFSMEKTWNYMSILVLILFLCRQ